MAKEKEFKNVDEENLKTESFKTVTFGGYDKNSVDYYIEDLKLRYEKEIEELKANVNKLSEAVLSLKTMREVNMNESNKTIEGLKTANADYESEIESLKEQLNAYKQREYESAGRYESISRTLLEARESADLLISQTTKKCEEQEAEVAARCEALENDTTDRCNTLEKETSERCAALEQDTKEKCQQMYDQTEATCASLKEQAYNESERTRIKAHEAAEALTAKTDYECKVQREEARKEAEDIVNQATSEAYTLRKNVKRECENVSKYMAELLASLDGVVDACCATKDVADRAFTGLKSEATSIVEDTAEEEAAQTVSE